MEESMVKTTTYANAISLKANEVAMEGIKKTGKTTVIELTPAQRDEWKKTLRKTHAQMSDRISPQLLQAIYKETGAGKP